MNGRIFILHNIIFFQRRGLLTSYSILKSENITLKTILNISPDIVSHRCRFRKLSARDVTSIYRMSAQIPSTLNEYRQHVDIEQIQTEKASLTCICHDINNSRTVHWGGCLSSVTFLWIFCGHQLRSWFGQTLNARKIQVKLFQRAHLYHL